MSSWCECPIPLPDDEAGLDTGEAFCWRCGRPIEPSDEAEDDER